MTRKGNAATICHIIIMTDRPKYRPKHKVCARLSDIQSLVTTGAHLLNMKLKTT